MRERIWRIARTSWAIAISVSGALAIALLPARYFEFISEYGGILGRLVTGVTREMLWASLAMVLISYIVWIDAGPSLLRWWRGRSRELVGFLQIALEGDKLSASRNMMRNIRQAEILRNQAMRIWFDEPVRSNALTVRLAGHEVPLEIIDKSPSTVSFRISDELLEHLRQGRKWMVNFETG